MIIGPNIKLAATALLVSVALAVAYQSGIERGEKLGQNAAAQDLKYRQQNIARLNQQGPWHGGPPQWDSPPPPQWAPDMHGDDSHGDGPDPQ
ncbi:MAG TPA: hypothetical protein VFE47_08660 [Tepidisphaeraceae bacterium]|nr:hypothetical protein [Tepidisphaeraceae bacterium]